MTTSLVSQQMIFGKFGYFFVQLLALGWNAPKVKSHWGNISFKKKYDFVYRSSCLSVCMSVCVAVCLADCVWIHEFCFLMRSAFVCQCLILLVLICCCLWLSVSLSIYLAICLSLCLSVCLSLWIHEFCSLMRLNFFCQCHILCLNLSLTVC